MQKQAYFVGTDLHKELIQACADSLVTDAEGVVIYAADQTGVISAWNAKKSELQWTSSLVSSAEDQVIRVWSVVTGETKFELKGHSAVVRRLSVDARSERLASADEQGTIKIWDLTKGVELGSLQSPAAVAGVAFIDKGKTLAAATGTCLTLWDVSEL